MDLYLGKGCEHIFYSPFVFTDHHPGEWVLRTSTHLVMTIDGRGHDKEIRDEYNFRVVSAQTVGTFQDIREVILEKIRQLDLQR